MKPAIIYVRFSDRPDAETSDSAEKQLARCADYASKNGLNVMAVHSDRGLSGADPNRPGLLAAMGDLRRGYTMIVSSLDRLARDVAISAWAFKKAQQAGARIVSVTGEGTNVSDSGDPMAKAMREVAAVFASLNRETNARRTSDAMRAKQAKGMRMSKIPPYGFSVADDGSLVPNEDEQANIQAVLTGHKNGLSLRKIAGKMQETRGNCRGCRWNHNLVSSIIRRDKGERISRPKQY